MANSVFNAIRKNSMGYQKIRMAGKVSLLVFVSSFLIYSTANAQKNSFTIGLDLTGKSSDNIEYTRENPTDDFYTLISPSMSYTRSSELSAFNMKALVDVIRYQDRSEQNRENQEYSITGDLSTTERTRWSYDLSFKDDITLEGELLDTGEVATWQQRRQYIGKGGVDWRFSERTGVGLDYQFLKKEFESRSSIDYDQHSISASLSRYLNNGIDAISLIPEFNYRESDYSTLDNYSLFLGWRHRFSEMFIMNIRLGGRYTEEEFDAIGLRYDNTGWVAGVEINRRTETSTLTIGYSRNLRANVRGGQTEVDRVTLKMNKWIFTRLGFGFSGSYYLRNREDGFEEARQVFYRVSPSLSFRLTEKQILELGYQYDNLDRDNITGNGTTEVNAVWAKLKLTYDKIF